MTGVSTLGQALDQIDRIKDQQLLYNSLSVQLTTGKKSQTFAGLGIDALLSKRTRADFTSLDTYNQNMTNTSRRIQLMLKSIEEFKAQAENFSQSLISFTQQSEGQKGEIVYYDDPLTPEDDHIAVGMTSDQPGVDFATIKESAGNVLGFLKDLVNAKDGDRYLLAGADTLSKPLNNTGTLDSAISAMIKGWKAGTISTSNVIANLQDRTTANGNPTALTDTIVGYSAGLSAGTVGKVYAQIDDASEVDYTVKGNEQSFRDVIVAATYLMNADLSPMIDTYKPPNAPPGVPDAQGAPGNTVQEMKDNFFAVFNKLTSMVNNAITDIDQLRFKLENVRARIDTVQKSNTAQKNLLQNTISDVENADTTEVAVRIQQLQAQLEASFRVTASLRDLTLSNFLPIR